MVWCVGGARGGVPVVGAARWESGARVVALAADLILVVPSPVAGAAKAFSHIAGAQGSTGWMASAVRKAAQALAPTLDHIRIGLRRSKVLNTDETGITINGSMWWTHVSCTAMLTLLTVSSFRGREGMKLAGIIEYFRGIAVHDVWAPYGQFDVVHALCESDGGDGE